MKKITKTIVVPLVRGDGRRLMRFDSNGVPDLLDPDKGRWPALIRRLQDSYADHGNGQQFITVTNVDINEINTWWPRGAGGKPGRGGWQGRIPIRSLSRFLTSNTPLCRLLDGLEPTPTVVDVRASYVYFKEIANRREIKIGFGNATRALRRRGTDNSEQFIDHLVVECETEHEARRFERRMHTQFAQYHIDGELYWADKKILKFCQEMAARQGGIYPERLRRGSRRRAS